MASTIIHYAISNIILEKINIKNTERFLLGAAIIPDSTSHEDDSYDRAHYETYSSDQMLKGFNWEQFYEEYKDHFWDDDLFLGYFCHLIQDAVWYHDIFDKYIRHNPRDVMQKLYDMGCDDYRRLNYLLIKYFALDKVNFSDINVPIEFITKERVANSLKLYDTWFLAKKCEVSELEMYKWDMMMDYIEKCVELCCEQIEAIQKKRETSVHPKDFFVVSRHIL